jgi:hypothetical protein
MDQALVFEKEDRIYIVGPVAPIQPQQSELEEFAFADVIRSEAPNELLLWLRGQYVEADRPNANGQLWTADDLAIASLTPKLMPVTVMHDPRTAVGLIADTRMLTPDEHQVPRSRIETALAIWKHRYPDVVEEALDNYARGSLTQSMECLPGFYDCAQCGRSFVKLPGGAESANWCAHLRAGAIETAGVSITSAPRRLRAVQFTGTGLIFGTRGARGAFDKAHLETFREEVAEFHERARTDTKRRQRRMDTIEIQRTEYDELRANATRAGELTQRVTGLEETAARLPALEKQVEELEIGKKKAEDDLAAERAKREQLEETARASTLADERLGKIGEPFKTKLPDSVKAKLEEQARTMSEEDWTERLEELAAMTGVKPDEQAPAPGSGGSFSREETARAQLGGGNGGAQEPSRTAVSTVLGGLLEQQRPKRPEPARK